mmetsp:Transcript_30226/g.54854  ORF Transcript_30226/g.54854 Transcript_30226/m.54854 type:complete len:107 (+) Transcript_30226:55-375(+)
MVMLGDSGGTAAIATAEFGTQCSATPVLAETSMQTPQAALASAAIQTQTVHEPLLVSSASGPEGVCSENKCTQTQAATWGPWPYVAAAVLAAGMTALLATSRQRRS